MKNYRVYLLTLLMISSLYAGEIEDKVDALIEEVESLKTSKSDTHLSSYTGLGAGLSKAYTSSEALSVGGYGHSDFINKLNSSGDTIDNYRAVLYLGYKFNERLIFNSETEFEHANELSVEFASIDFIVNTLYNWRIGNFIVPVGHINVKHEPTMFYTVSRPESERSIIPSTWHENGIMLYGSLSDWEYSLSIVAALDANNGVTIRAMRDSASNSASEDLAAVVRLCYKPSNSFEIAASVYFGEADQGNSVLDGVTNTLAHIHAIYKIGALELRAFYAQTETTNAQKVSLEHNESAASASNGYYFSAAYKLDNYRPFIRYEAANTFLRGFDSAGNILQGGSGVRSIALGINYFPHEQVVIKTDYLYYQDNGVQDNKVEFGIGYLF